MKKLLKKLMFNDSPDHLHAIKYGVAKGLKMRIDIYSKSQRILGLDEAEIQGYFKEYSQKCSHFFDIGASDGYYALIYRKYNPTGQMYLFDANLRFHAEQIENFRINGFKTDFKQIAKFVSEAESSDSIRIDQFFTGKHQNVFFKVDVDGGELSVLKGAKEVIASNNCFFIIETHSKQLEDDCIHFLEALGYETKIIKQAFWRVVIPEQRPIEHNQWFIATKK
jgi:hypothetical protein